MIDRRNFLLAGAVLASGCFARTPGDGASGAVQPDFRPVVALLGPGGRLGVAALDTGSGRTVGHDAQSRYAMCSTFKAPLAAAILAEVDRGVLELDREIPFGRADLVNNSPVVEAHLARGRLPVGRLCAAAVEVSDNAAANLLLARIGGPPGLTRFFRRAGDAVTRLDRVEPALNAVRPGDPRDTTTPAAMVDLMRALLVGEVLSEASRAHLIGWMEGATTGRDRLRAGLPIGWRAGDKTGTAGHANNDVAIAWPPGRAPILIASYTTSEVANPALRNAVHASVARTVVAAFA